MSRYDDFTLRSARHFSRRDRAVDTEEMAAHEAAAATAIQQVTPLLPGAHIEYQHMAGSSYPAMSFLVSRKGWETSTLLPVLRSIARIAGFEESQEFINKGRAAVFIPIHIMAQIQDAASNPVMAEKIGDAWKALETPAPKPSPRR